MSGVDLDVYGQRLAHVLSVAPPRTRQETVSWVLQPLCTNLGWSVAECRSGGTIGPLAYDLCLLLDHNPPTPAALVAAESADTALSTERMAAIGAAMTQSGIDRALYSNGRRFVLFAGDGSDRVEIDYDALAERTSTVSQLSRSTVADHCRDRRSEVLRQRRLAVSRESIAESIETLLAQSLGSTLEIDDAVFSQFFESLDASQPDDSRTSVTEEADELPAELPLPSSTESNTDAQPATDVPTSVQPPSDVTGEYVVRVFAERGSVGAVGHSTSAGALAEAAAYFFERGLSGIRIPWRPDDEPIVVNSEPVDETGTRWPAFETLPNGLYVNSAGSIDDRARRVEALAARAGFRVMLTGDWEN